MLSKPIKYILPFALLITTALCALMFKISYIDSKGDLDFLLYNTPIPRIIHQSWKTHELPEKFLEWATSWKHKNPDFAYKLWNDTENRNLIVEHYPWFLHTYDSLPQNIHRVDASRLFYMHKYGGIYSDLDLECLQPMSNLLKDQHGIVIARMGNSSFSDELPNAWFASVPGHPFWQVSVNGRMHYAKLIMDASNWQERIEKVAGPVALRKALANYLLNSGQAPVTVLDGRYIFPFDWNLHQKNDAVLDICLPARTATFDPEMCKNLVDPQHLAYAISYWSHSWGIEFHGWGYDGNNGVLPVKEELSKEDRKVVIVKAE